MTASFQSSFLSYEYKSGNKNRSRRYQHSQNFYQASITDFEGDEYDFDVMADSYEEAAAQLEVLAADAGIQVYNMNIYLLG